MNEAIAQALESSFWKKLPRELVEPLFAEGVYAEATAGLTVGEEDAHNRIALVLTGLFRMFVRGKSGRQVTVNYAREGDTIGLTSVLLRGQCNMGLQALSAGSLWVLGEESLRRHSLADARLALAIAEESARRTYEMAEELADNTFGTVRQRVARHLLDLVVEAPETGGLVAPISQQALANAVGTAREVVSRVLVAFRKEGVVRATEVGVEVLDATRLYESSQISD